MTLGDFIEILNETIFTAKILCFFEIPFEKSKEVLAKNNTIIRDQKDKYNYLNRPANVICKDVYRKRSKLFNKNLKELICYLFQFIN